MTHKKIIKTISKICVTSNIRCSCGKYFDNDLIIVVSLPCMHMYHESCYNKHILSNKKNCLICNKKIWKIKTEEQILQKKSYKQLSINLRSVKYVNTLITDYTKIAKVISFMSIINKLLLAKSTDDIYNVLTNLLKTCNFKIVLRNLTKKNEIEYNKHITWKDKCNKIIVSNHCNYFDSIIIYYLFNCGFLASDEINKIEIGKLIAEKCKLLIFKRGSPQNMVEKIKEYLKSQNIIAIFPSGSMSYGNTIHKFRSGAFHACDNIVPVTVKYYPDFHHPDFLTLLFRLFTQDEIKVEVSVSDMVHGPFNDEKIEKLRISMGKVCGSDLSNISNRSIKD